MSEDEWEAERRKNDATDRHGRGSKRDGNQANPGGNRKNEAPPKGGQIDDGGKYES